MPGHGHPRFAGPPTEPLSRRAARTPCRPFPHRKRTRRPEQDTWPLFGSPPLQPGIPTQAAGRRPIEIFDPSAAGESALTVAGVWAYIRPTRRSRGSDGKVAASGTEAAGGFEPPNRGFADRCLNPLATPPGVERKTGFEPATFSLARRRAPVAPLPPGCRGRDLNPHALSAPPPQDGVSARFHHRGTVCAGAEGFEPPTGGFGVHRGRAPGQAVSKWAATAAFLPHFTAPHSPSGCRPGAWRNFVKFRDFALRA
jgi:hypothetical protein